MTAGNLKEPSSVCVERKASALSNGQNAQLNLDRKGSLKAVEGLKPKVSRSFELVEVLKIFHFRVKLDTLLA